MSHALHLPLSAQERRLEKLLHENKSQLFDAGSESNATKLTSPATGLVSKVFDVQRIFGGSASDSANRYAAHELLVDEFAVSVAWNKRFPAGDPTGPTVLDALFYVETQDPTSRVDEAAVFYDEEPPVDITAALNAGTAFKTVILPATRIVRFRVQASAVSIPIAGAFAGIKLVMQISGRMRQPFFGQESTRRLALIQSQMAREASSMAAVR